MGQYLDPSAAWRGPPVDFASAIGGIRGEYAAGKDYLRRQGWIPLSDSIVHIACML
ncbi:MAG TPA: hypothetical protein VGR47_03305 [Terracidiphilus sp.]|nr:hypothetical protein [Terracidiphilus sp.]